VDADKGDPDIATDIDRIKSFWKPGGMVDPAHEKRPQDVAHQEWD